MSLFWMLAGILVVVALLFLLPPLLRKPRAAAGVESDQLTVQVVKDQLDELRADLASGRLDESAYAAARHDLERTLLEDVKTGKTATAAPEPRSGRWMAVVLLLAVPAMAVLLYLRLGALPTEERIAAADAAVQAATNNPHALEEMVAKLAARMQQEPDNVEGWALLGRSYAALGHFDDSAAAYRHALELAPGNPDILSSYADVLVTAGNGAFTDEVGQLLDRAVAADPQHLKSLWLRGHWRYRHDDLKGAVDDWRKVAAGLPPGDENIATIQGQIRLAQNRLGQPLDEIVATTGQDTGAADAAAPAAAGAGHLQVSVALDPALADKVAPDDTLFIFARAVQGPRMPLAIVRKRAAELPVTVTLDDSQAMSPAMKLSGFPQVAVGARVSKSGQAMPSSGDLEGSVSPVSTTGSEVSITIDQVVP
jgi:cytochrome c-type biogenesis protein CcmH